MLTIESNSKFKLDDWASYLNQQTAKTTYDHQPSLKPQTKLSIPNAQSSTHIFQPAGLYPDLIQRTQTLSPATFNF